MSLTNEDLKKIRGVVKEEVDQSIADKVRPIIKEEISEAIETKVRPIIKEEIDQAIETKVRPIIKEEIDQAIETKVRPIVQEEVDKGVEFLAAITKKEFDIVYAKIDSVKVDIADHDFKMTELVPKVQHFYLEQRVRRLEEKAGIRREK